MQPKLRGKIRKHILIGKKHRNGVCTTEWVALQRQAALAFFENRREQVELLEMHKDGIVVAEYWTALPPKAELEAKLAEIVRDAQERLARRSIESNDDEGV